MNEGNILVRQHLLEIIRARIRLVARRRQSLVERLVYLSHLSRTPSSELTAVEEEIGESRRLLSSLIRQEAYLLREIWVAWGQSISATDTESE